MFLKILKKDLKRSKTMNVILFLFIILATVFVASGLNNLTSVLNGMDYFMDLAVGEKGDYFLGVNVGKDDSALREVLDNVDAIKSYAMDKYFGYDNEIRDNDGKKIDWNGAIMIQSPESSYIKFFDSENNEITNVEKGHVYITKKFFDKFDVKTGDKITLKLENENREYIIDGPLKDAVFGAQLTAGYRFLMNEGDANEYFESKDAEFKTEMFVYIESDDIEKINTEINDIEGLYGGYARSMLVLTRIVELIVAFIIVILSVCLMIVSFVILKFSIGFSIQDDFREIGVMKAIGIRNLKIRTLYLTKYTALAATGAVIGLIISYPFGKMLLKSVSEGMVLGNSYGNMINIAGAVLVFAVIILLAFLSTGKVKKMTPVDAVRSGETGERFNKKKGIRISRSHAGNTTFLSWNDILSSPRRYLNIVISFGICTLFLLVLANFTTTLDSPVFADQISHSSDIYLDKEDVGALDIQRIIDRFPDELKDSGIADKKELPVSFFAQFEHGKEMYEMYLDLVEEKLADMGMPAKAYNDIVFSYTIKSNGEEFVYSLYQVVGDRYGDYLITEGSAPQNKNEIAITPQVRETLGLDIGDAIEIDFDGVYEKCIVTGVFPCMNNTGMLIRIHDDAPTTLAHYMGSMCTQISFTDDPSQKEIENRKEKIKDIFNTEHVRNRTEETINNMGALDAMKAAELLFVAITLIVVILVTIMMERSFIAKETKQIAILKATGFRDGDVIKWQVKRFGIIALIAVVIAMALSIPVTRLAGDAIFSILGAAKINWLFSITGMAKYPLILVAVTLLITWITSLYTKKINARDTACIE